MKTHLCALCNVSYPDTVAERCAHNSTDAHKAKLLKELGAPAPLVARYEH